MWAQTEPIEVTLTGGSTSLTDVLLGVLPSVVAVLVVVVSNRSQRKRQQDDFKEQRAQRRVDLDEERRRRDEERAEARQADRMASYAAMLTALDEMTEHGAEVATEATPADSAALQLYDQAQRTLVRECLRASLFAEPEDQGHLLSLAKLLDRVPHPVRARPAWTTMTPPAPPHAAEILALATAAVHKRVRIELGLDTE